MADAEKIFRRETSKVWETKAFAGFGGLSGSLHKALGGGFR